MTAKAQSRAFVPYHLNTGFANNVNLKNSVQDRIGADTESNCIKAFNDIQGDSKEHIGTGFDEVVLLALAYFFANIFPENHSIKDEYWTVEAVKGFLDARNHSPYTPIYESVNTSYPLNKTALFNHCWIIIQTSYFFNSDHFGRHQYLIYAAHYTRTGEQLPLDEYTYDKGDLLKQYKRLDERKRKGTLPSGEIEYYYVTQWYYHVLFLVVNELKLNTKNFIITYTRGREYNISIKAPSNLRYETPFVLMECDIKSAYPSILDALIGSTKGKTIYEKIMEVDKCDRPTAKVSFNKLLNSGEYISKEKTIKKLIEWGYDKDEAENITEYTHDPDVQFYDHMTEIEEDVVKTFARANGIDRYIRLHDGSLHIDDRISPVNMDFEDGIIRLNVERPLQPVVNRSFGYSHKRLPYAYISSVPPLKDVTARTTPPKAMKILGKADGFQFYNEKFEYFSAHFNLNDLYSLDEFLAQCENMLSTIQYLSNRNITKLELWLIVRHIRWYSNIMFSERYLFNLLKKNIGIIEDVEIKERDYELYKKLNFRKKIDFLKAMNVARGKVNSIMYLKRIKQLFLKSIANDKYEWIDFGLPDKRGRTTLHHYLASRINNLRTGRKRSFEAQTRKQHPLYSNMYKEGAVKPFEPMVKTKFSNGLRLVQRKIQKYERELLAYMDQQNNRNKAQQYTHLISELLGEEINSNIPINNEILKAEKQIIAKELGHSFKKLILITKEIDIDPHTPVSNDFNTSLEHSAFSIGIEEAYNRGEQFFQEYLRFHNISEKQEEVVQVKKKKEMVFPELNFDEWD